MKRLLTIGLATLSLGLAGAAVAQPAMQSHTRVAPNGSVHTTTRVETPNGTEVRHTDRRADGTTRVVERTHTGWSNEHHTGWNNEHHANWNNGHHYGWTRGRHHGWHHAGWNNDRVCHTTWRHHERVRHCWSRHEHHHD